MQDLSSFFLTKGFLDLNYVIFYELLIFVVSLKIYETRLEE